MHVYPHTWVLKILNRRESGCVMYDLWHFFCLLWIDFKSSLPEFYIIIYLLKAGKFKYSNYKWHELEIFWMQPRFFSFHADHKHFLLIFFPTFFYIFFIDTFCFKLMLCLFLTNAMTDLIHVQVLRSRDFNWLCIFRVSSMQSNLQFDNWESCYLSPPTLSLQFCHGSGKFFVISTYSLVYHFLCRLSTPPWHVSKF